MRVLRDDQLRFAAEVLHDPVVLLAQHEEIDHHAGRQDGLHTGVEDARRYLMRAELHSSVDHRVSGVRPAVEPDDHRRILGQ